MWLGDVMRRMLRLPGPDGTPKREPIPHELLATSLEERRREAEREIRKRARALRELQREADLLMGDRGRQRG